jgi:TPR repeat protein
MVDLREKIIALAEECLHSFIEERLRVLKMDDGWRDNLANFVNEQYKSHPENMESLHSFLLNHTVEEVNIRDLDITATVPLLTYYPDFSKLYSNGFKGKTSHTFKSCFFDFQNVRNLIKHYTAEISESQREEFALDQFDALCCIIRFAVLCSRNCDETECWKGVLNRALYMQGILRREKWFVLQAEREADISPDSDLSDLEIEAETGNTEAQVLLGKMLLEGKRYGLDRDKAFMWFFKAARKQNAEAMYYLGECYRTEAGVDFNYQKGMEWIKKSSDLGFAPAQYEDANQYFARIELSDEEKQYMAEHFIKSADQKYPPAMWALGLCYEIGRGVNKDPKKGLELEEEAALSGYVFAAEQLAEKAEKKKDYETAKKWYEIAAKYKSERAIRALERYERRGHS